MNYTHLNYLEIIIRVRVNAFICTSACMYTIHHSSCEQGEDTEPKHLRVILCSTFPS